MRLTFKHFDGRCLNFRDVTDEDNANVRVGHIRSNGTGFSGGGGGGGGIEIYLFGGRYQATVNTYDQCWGFVKGVETVLRQATSLREMIPADTVSDAA